MIKVREINAHTDGSTDKTNGSSLQEPCHLFLLDGLYEPGYHHRDDDKQIIIGHLYVVRIDLKGCKDGCQQQSPEIFPPISQYQTSYHRWQIGQCPHLPDMASSNDDEEIGGESPDNGAQGCQMLAEVECPKQDIEAQEVGEYIPHVLRQPQMIGIHHLRQQIR